jgi:hypothetical protein
MQDGTLLLGPVLFQDFEVPERITWGGDQRVAVHRLPGGTRIVDILGRDDAEIAWSGIFSGEDAAVRARLLDTLRAAGGVWPLTWDAFFYSVVITRFVADYTRENWIPYRIACTVLRDEAEAVIDAVVSLGADALSDFAAGAGFAVTSPIAASLSAASAAIGVIGAATAGTAAYAAATTAVGAASTQLDGAVTQAEATLTAATDPGVAADSAGTLAALTNARGYVRRTAVNLANASS